MMFYERRKDDICQGNVIYQAAEKVQIEKKGMVVWSES